MRRRGWGRQTFPPKMDHGGSADHSERRPTHLEPLKPGSYVFNIGLVERKKNLCVYQMKYMVRLNLLGPAVRGLWLPFKDLALACPLTQLLAHIDRALLI